MKCDECRNMVYEPNANDCNCGKGQWFGIGDTETDTDQSLWDDCQYFEPADTPINTCKHTDCQDYEACLQTDFKHCYEAVDHSAL